MKQLVCEKWAGETIAVHGLSVAFDAEGLCIGVVQVDDYGKMTLEALPDAEAEYLLQFGYVHLEGEAPPVPPAEMAVVADDDANLSALTYKQLQALAAERGISPVGMKKADLLEALEAEA